MNQLQSRVAFAGDIEQIGASTDRRASPTSAGGALTARRLTVAVHCEHPGSRTQSVEERAVLAVRVGVRQPSLLRLAGTHFDRWQTEFTDPKRTSYANSWPRNR